MGRHRIRVCCFVVIQTHNPDLPHLLPQVLRRQEAANHTHSPGISTQVRRNQLPRSLLSIEDHCKRMEWGLGCINEGALCATSPRAFSRHVRAERRDLLLHGSLNARLLSKLDL